MRILALVTEAFGGRGGIAQYNRDLLTAIGGHPGSDRIEVLPRLAPDPPGDLPPAVRQRTSVMGRIAYAFKSLRLALRLRPDLVFCGHLFMAPLAAVVARFLGAKLVVQLHGIEAWGRPGPAQRRAIEAADLILCVSRDTRARTLDWAAIAPEKVIVAPNTVSPAFTPGDLGAARLRFGLSDEVVLLSVGRLDANEQYKGQDRVIGALPRALRAEPNLIYLVAGDGDDLPRLRALAHQYGVAEHVRFMGRVAPEALADLYRAADLFVLPSTGEGFGIVYLEAMACGTPALGIAAAGAIDPLGDGRLGIVAELSAFEQALSGAVAGLRTARIDPSARLERSRGALDRFSPEAFRGFLMSVFAQLT